MTTTKPTRLLDQPVPDDSILRQFTSTDPTSPWIHAFADLMLSWNYCGDCTENGDRRLKAAMGDEAYEHYHWDTLACNGYILLRIPQYKHPLIAKECRSGPRFPAQWFWCMSAIVEGGDNVMPAYPAMVASVSIKNQEELAVLPGLEYVRVTEMRIYSNGKPKREKPPSDVVFFRFQRGVGCVVCTPKTRT